MKIKSCKTCGCELNPKLSQCPECKAPLNTITARHYSISVFIVLPAFIFLVTQFSKHNYSEVFPFNAPLLTRATSRVEARPPIKVAEKNLMTVYVKGRVVNLRQHPTTDSPTLWQFKKGQALTQVARSGNWTQVLADGAEKKRGWIHTSLVEKVSPDPSLKTSSPHQAYSAFRKYFSQFNAEIKILKGTAFFESVEYLDRGAIQVTATGIFLSAPESYKKKYVGKIARKWQALRKPGLRAAVKIVDAKGILRMEQKRG